MRFGFTTGSCAAAAAKAAIYMLLTGKRKEQISIITPKQITFHAKIVDIKMSENRVSCAVIKDGGDDPDVTTGAHICATVWCEQNDYDERMDSGAQINHDARMCSDAQMECDGRINHDERINCDKKANIIIKGGDGVGRVTKPGLDQPVGEAAINHVPRQMIEKEVREVIDICDCNDTVYVEISVDGGEKLAEKTFNPRLGIVGGISILGTSGIVEPMSAQALKDTIRVELSQKKALGYKIAAVSPGNYGLDFMKKTYGYDLDKSIKCSNFIGDTIDMARELGFSSMLLTGHIGKLVKVSGGIMNTHSHEGDCRMELLAAAAIRAASTKTRVDSNVVSILDAVTTEEGVRILKEAGMLEQTMDEMMDKIMFYLRKRATDAMQIECMVYSNEFGLLAQSAGATKLLEELL